MMRVQKMPDKSQTTASAPRLLADTTPAVSSNVVIITRGELELMLLRAFEDGMNRAVENIQRNRS